MSEQTEQRPNPRKVREGLVVSTSMDKTAVVAIVDRVRIVVITKQYRERRNYSFTILKMTSMLGTEYVFKKHVLYQRKNDGGL